MATAFEQPLGSPLTLSSGQTVQAVQFGVPAALAGNALLRFTGRKVGSGECVAILQSLAGVPHTSHWFAGPPISQVWLSPATQVVGTEAVEKARTVWNLKGKNTQLISLLSGVPADQNVTFPNTVRALAWFTVRRKSGAHHVLGYANRSKKSHASMELCYFGASEQHALLDGSQTAIVFDQWTGQPAHARKLRTTPGLPSSYEQQGLRPRYYGDAANDIQYSRVIISIRDVASERVVPVSLLGQHYEEFMQHEILRWAFASESFLEDEEVVVGPIGRGTGGIY